MPQIDHESRITDIQPTKRRGRFNISIDGEFALAVGEKVMIELGLRSGQIVDQARLKALAEASERERAMNTALRYLEVRPRSRREIEQRLTRSEFEPDVKAYVVSRLRELKLIDDADFAQRWIESRSRTRPKGVRSLKSELALKGVARDEIDAAVENISTDDEIALARAALVKHLGSKRTAPTDKTELEKYNQRLVGFLQRRGFGWSTIKAAMSLEIEEPCDED